MAQYKYTAQDRKGKKVSGTMNSVDEAELQRRLRERDLYLLSAKELRQAHGKRAFPPSVLADYSRQLGTLTAAGVTLARALAILAKSEAIKPRERAVYEDLLRQIRQGTALSDAMESQGGVFPQLLVYMYRSAEAGGNFDEVALRMAELYEKQHKMKGKVSAALTYPKILALMILGVILVITNYIMPRLAGLLELMDNLPAPTKLLFAVSDFMTGYWYVMLAAVVGGFFLWRWLQTRPAFRQKWHRVILHVPVAGKLQRTICTSRFASTLSSLYAAGIPIISALQIARSTSGNDYIDMQFDEVIPVVRAGESLSEGLMQVDGLTGKLCDSVRIGEETGSLDSMLQSVSDSLEFDADVAISKLVSYVEPVMMIAMGIVVAFVLFAVFGAIYGSYDMIAGMAG